MPPSLLAKQQRWKLKGVKMPNSKSGPSDGIIWIAGIVVLVVLLAGAGGRLGFRVGHAKSVVSGDTPAARPAVAPEAAVDPDSIILKEEFVDLDSGKWPKNWKGWESSKNSRMT